MEPNTIGNILLFSVKNGAREIQIKIGELPVVIDAAGKSSRLNGLLPISKASFEELKLKYLESSEYEIMQIATESFLVYRLMDFIVFRHLPVVKSLEHLDRNLSASSYSKNGIIVILSDSQDLRIKNTYATASLVVDNGKTNILVAENEKYYRLKSNKLSKITELYRPDLDTETLINISAQISFDCLVLPNCLSHGCIERINGIAQEKLIVMGTQAQLLRSVSEDLILCVLNISDDGAIVNRNTKNIVIDEGLIIRKLKEVKYA